MNGSKNIKRVVVKVGTSTLAYPTGKLCFHRIESVVRQLADLHNQGIEVILVTSGAVGAGMGRLGLKARPKTIPQKQAVAAVGQCILMQVYEKLFSEYGQIVAQVLLTAEDIALRKRYLNARNTLMKIFEYGAIPIINENDTVAVDELKVGDNDRLSALVASLIHADLLVILSDIDGLYTKDPRRYKDAKLIPVVNEITEDIEALCGGAGSNVGTGGMYTKIEAAKIATGSGIPMVITNGARENAIIDTIQKEGLGTLFIPREDKLDSRSRWIAFNLNLHGHIYVDAGAKEALINGGKSLLPSGVLRVEGDFDLGDVVGILDSDGKEFARGLVNYACHELDKIKGLQTADIEGVLGYKYYDEVIHRDNLVCLSVGRKICH